MRDCEAVNPVVRLEGRGVHPLRLPTTAMVAKFMYWSLRKAPQGEMRDIARSLVSSSVRSALKGKKPL